VGRIFGRARYARTVARSALVRQAGAKKRRFGRTKKLAFLLLNRRIVSLPSQAPEVSSAAVSVTPDPAEPDPAIFARMEALTAATFGQRRKDAARIIARTGRRSPADPRQHRLGPAGRNALRAGV
jgi:hypothetical protein